MDHDPYLYHVLSADTDEIRVVRIRPGNDDEPIQCSLSHQAAGAYHCFSYTWGDPPANKLIFINGKLFNIRTSLYECLRIARRYQLTEALWIDAICINQADDAEKSQQVQRMDRIYRRARSVILWLGMTDDDIAVLLGLQEAIEQTKYLSMYTWKDGEVTGVRFLEKKWLELPARRCQQQAETLLIDFWKPFTLSQGRVPLSKKERFTENELWLLRMLTDPAISKFNHSEYWKRAWIVQEVDVAKRVQILTQQGSLSFWKIYPFLRAQLSSQGGTVKKALLHDYPFEANYEELELGYTGMRRKTLCEGLSMTVRRKCADPKDRIYSILSLVDNGHRLPVDYGSSAEHLFWEAINFVGLHESSFEGYGRDWSPDAGSLLRKLDATALLAIKALGLSPPAPGPQVSLLLDYANEIDKMERCAYWIFHHDQREEKGPWRRGYSGIGLCVAFKVMAQALLIWWVPELKEIAEMVFSEPTVWLREDADSIWRVHNPHHKHQRGGGEKAPRVYDVLLAFQAAPETSEERPERPSPTDSLERFEFRPPQIEVYDSDSEF